MFFLSTFIAKSFVLAADRHSIVYFCYGGITPYYTLDVPAIQKIIYYLSLNNGTEINPCVF